MPLEERPDYEGQFDGVVNRNAQEDNNCVAFRTADGVNQRVVVSDHVGDSQLKLMRKAAWRRYDEHYEAFLGEAAFYLVMTSPLELLIHHITIVPRSHPC